MLAHGFLSEMILLLSITLCPIRSSMVASCFSVVNESARFLRPQMFPVLYGFALTRRLSMDPVMLGTTLAFCHFAPTFR